MDFYSSHQSEILSSFGCSCTKQFTLVIASSGGDVVMYFFYVGELVYLLRHDISLSFIETEGNF